MKWMMSLWCVLMAAGFGVTLAPAAAGDSKAIRVACLGDTPTDMTNYPKDLGKYLNEMKADVYDVQNFGVPDTLIGFGTDKPYVKTAKYQQALKFEPHIVVIMFGSQDTQKGRNFATHDTFVAEYKKLIASFTDLPTHPKVYICLPPPIMATGQWGLNNENLVSTVIPNIKKVAEDLKLPLIDTNTPFVGHPELFHDNVHLVGESNIILAGAVFHALTGKEPPENPKKTTARAVTTSTAPSTQKN